MKIIHRVSDLKRPFRCPVLAIGVFDGLHHGHRKLIQKAIRRARAIGGQVVVMTFDPHPRQVICPGKELPLISSPAYRLKLLEEMGVDACIVVKFTKRFASLDPKVFIRRYLRDRIGAVEVIVGDDFYFGRDRRGDVGLLMMMAETCGFKVHVIGTRRKGSKQVSSSRIREFIREGDIRHAQHLLDRPVAVYGQVVRGDQRGRLLGFPTANLNPYTTGMAPIGVYCVRVTIRDRVYFGMANIGHRPSFKRKAPVNIEVHIFDFRGNLYGQNILVEFLKRIRDEHVFSSQASLAAQLQSDAVSVRQWFKSHFFLTCKI